MFYMVFLVVVMVASLVLALAPPWLPIMFCSLTPGSTSSAPVHVHSVPDRLRESVKSNAYYIRSNSIELCFKFFGEVRVTKIKPFRIKYKPIDIFRQCVFLGTTKI
ncbi:hypothetical protein ATANTOWER_020179 [Ataeniobius toweri]|uniref:Secreted protein n=1 Tax=Ataeniobius toweri TaxID=208326 RepID=A0ABU7AYU1_9TELE|nr:hypothetical protein [Ataeniobius toweri]